MAIKKRKTKRRSKKQPLPPAITIIILIIVLIMSFIPSKSTPPDSELTKVIKVVDGDTIHVMYNGKKEKIRMIGIDTPESVHPNQAKNVPEGKIASDFTKSQLSGKEVRLEFDVEMHDKYGRLLAYVWIDDKMFNELLLENGYARLATFPPNVKYVENFKKIQKDAQKNKKGFWKTDFYK